MTDEPFSLQEMLLVRTRLLRELPAALTHDQRRFLVSLAEAQPESLLDVPACVRAPGGSLEAAEPAKISSSQPHKTLRATGRVGAPV